MGIPTAYLDEALVKEYCNDEIFEAHCQDNEVILMSKAIHGRMKEGRCVTSFTEKQYMGCSENVIRELDSKCSRLQECSVEVKSLESVKNCNNQLKTYLEASYQCIPVHNGFYSNCTSKTSNRKGYLSNIIYDDSMCGSTEKPWIIEVLPGQQISITIYNFKETRTSGCLPIGNIYEPGTKKNITICVSPLEREKVVMVSSARVVHIMLLNMSNKLSKGKAEFILKYEVIGCVDMDTDPSTADYKRNGSQATVTCIYTDQSWNVYCEGNKWTGSVGYCPHEDEAVSYPSTESSVGLSNYVMLITVIIAASIVTASVIIIVGVCVVCRRRGNLPGVVPYSFTYTNPSSPVAQHEYPYHTVSRPPIDQGVIGAMGTPLTPRFYRHGNETIVSDSDYFSQNYSTVGTNESPIMGRNIGRNEWGTIAKCECQFRDEPLYEVCEGQKFHTLREPPISEATI